MLYRRIPIAQWKRVLTRILLSEGVRRGVDFVCRKLEAYDMQHLTFYLDNFILKITVPKVVSEQETSMKIEWDNVNDNHLEESQKVTDELSRYLIG